MEPEEVEEIEGAGQAELVQAEAEQAEAEVAVAVRECLRS